MKELRFANTQESCFETWKRSYMGCSALLCCRFDVSQESCFQASKRSNMGSSVLQGGRSANIHEFCFQAAKRADMDCVEQQRNLFADCPEWHFRSRNVQIIAVSSYQRVDLLIFTNIVSGCETLKYVQFSPAMSFICR